ncbi:hypothetical protein VE03_10461 [Pseudogymnoascus sp. 23342-1-I1]|nr:hypothetical protein VE03_10461 [Pseudogymnoascus sp. 23342-1-I1]
MTTPKSGDKEETPCVAPGEQPTLSPPLYGLSVFEFVQKARRDAVERARKRRAEGFIDEVVVEAEDTATATTPQDTAIATTPRGPSSLLSPATQGLSYTEFFQQARRDAAHRSRRRRAEE